MSYHIRNVSKHDFAQGIKIKKKFTSIEENNNEINILATNFEDMGNLTDKCKEKFLGKSSDNKSFQLDNGEYSVSMSRNRLVMQDDDFDYDYASDDFENEEEDDEKRVDVEKIKTVATVHSKGVVKKYSPHISARSDEVESKKITKSPDKIDVKSAMVQSKKVMSRNMSSSNTSLSGTVGGQSRRLNMSFTQERAKEIHRENHILMQKLMKTRSTISSSSKFSSPIPSRESSAAIARRKQQEKTSYENLILLRKIQNAKSFHSSVRR